jgi:hypothetical protein
MRVVTEIVSDTRIDRFREKLATALREFDIGRPAEFYFSTAASSVVQDYQPTMITEYSVLIVWRIES